MLEIPHNILSMLREHKIIDERSVISVNRHGVVISDKCWYGLENGETLLKILESLELYSPKGSSKVPLDVEETSHQNSRTVKAFNWGILMPILCGINITVCEESLFGSLIKCQKEIIHILKTLETINFISSTKSRRHNSSETRGTMHTKLYATQNQVVENQLKNAELMVMADAKVIREKDHKKRIHRRKYLLKKLQHRVRIPVEEVARHPKKKMGQSIIKKEHFSYAQHKSKFNIFQNQMKVHMASHTHKISGTQTRQRNIFRKRLAQRNFRHKHIAKSLPHGQRITNKQFGYNPKLSKMIYRGDNKKTSTPRVNTVAGAHALFAFAIPVFPVHHNNAERIRYLEHLNVERGEFVSGIIDKRCIVDYIFGSISASFKLSLSTICKLFSDGGIMFIDMIINGPYQKLKT